MFPVWHRKVKIILLTGNNTSTVNASLWLEEDLQSLFIFVFLSKHCGFACKEILFSFWHVCISLFSFKQFCWAAAQVWPTLSSYSMAVTHCEMLLKARQPCRGQIPHGEGREEFSLISLAPKPEHGFSWEATAIQRWKFKFLLPGDCSCSCFTNVQCSVVKNFTCCSAA